MRFLGPGPAFGGGNRVAHQHAIVIGPTPPGTGVIARARSRGGRELDVADELALGACD